jgi:hypothetical protein
MAFGSILFLFSFCMDQQIQNFLKNKSPQEIKKYALGFVILAIVGGVTWGVASGPINAFLGERGLKLDKNSTVGVSFDKEKMWPSTMPSDVPRIEEGGIWSQKYDSDKNIWNVSFKDIPETVGNGYEARLESNGWTITKNDKNDSAKTMMIYAEKGQLLLNYSQNFNVQSGSLKVEKRPLYKVQ